jgi:hypothetical protein
MLLRDANRDNLFKHEIAKCIDVDRLQVRSLLDRLRQEHEYAAFGAAFKSLGKNQVEDALVQLRRDRQAASGTDESALFLLKSIIDLLPFAEPSGIVEFSNLPPRAKTDFVFALEQAAELGNSVTRNELARTEVDAICSGGFPVTRLGQHSDSILGDILLRGNDADRAFVVDQLDRLHDLKIPIYDSCYPQLINARRKSRSADLRKRMVTAMRRIERDNPSATLSIVASDVILAIESGANPLKQFRAGSQLRKFSTEDIYVLALGVAGVLDASGKHEAAVEILGIAAQHAGTNPKLRAWVGLALGDTVNAARAMFDYGLSSPHGIDRFDEIDRSHAIEAACRQLFRAEPVLARREYQLQLGRYEATGATHFADFIRTWQGALDGFEKFMQLRLERARAGKFDPDEMSMSLRASAELSFLEGVDEDFEERLKQGISLFEKSAVGNSAPWIQGERLLLKAVQGSLKAIGISGANAHWRQTCSSVEECFLDASNLLHSPYPLAVSLAFRGISRSRSKVAPSSVRDLTLAVDMLDPKTPELLELRERIANARWLVIEALSTQKALGILPAGEVWTHIARLVPLLSEIIDEDGRLREHFSPARNLVFSRMKAYDLEEFGSIRDPNQRGRFLEDFITTVVNASKGLRVVDVRHRNNYEEIDVIVSITKYNPLLSHWGPLLLIECKNWKGKVGTEPVRSFYTKMTTKKGAVRLGVIIAPAGFTKGVRELSRLLPDALIVAMGPNEIQQVAVGDRSFVDVLEGLIPGTLFG